MQRVIINGEKKRDGWDNQTDVKFMQLWDWYGGFLTPTQREIANLYFECDLSLGEIAEQKGVSRQSISDCLQKSRKKLEEADEKLHFIQAIQEASQEYSWYRTQVMRWAAREKKLHPEWEREIAELEGFKGSEEEEIIDLDE